MGTHVSNAKGFYRNFVSSSAQEEAEIEHFDKHENVYALCTVMSC